MLVVKDHCSLPTSELPTCCLKYENDTMRLLREITYVALRLVILCRIVFSEFGGTESLAWPIGLLVNIRVKV